MILKHLLVAVQGELLTAHWADFPVALHMLLKLALVIVGWEDDLTQRASLHVHAWYRIKRAKEKRRERKLMLISSQVTTWANQESRLIKSICLMQCGWPAATNKRGLCSRTNTLHMLQCTGLETVWCSKRGWHL